MTDKKIRGRIVDGQIELIDDFGASVKIDLPIRSSDEEHLDYIVEIKESLQKLEARLLKLEETVSVSC